VSPFDVLIPAVPDAELGALLTELNARGYNPSVLTGGAGTPTGRRGGATNGPELPTDWRLVREVEGQSYAWPREREQYIRYRVFAADTLEGTVHIALGECERAEAWGRDRKYLIAFLTSGSPQTPLVEFLEGDDYTETRELVAIIRGSDGGKKMYAPTDQLPDVYDQHFQVGTYNDRIVYSRSWNKLAVIAHEDDDATMLNHALVQARRRGDV